AMDNAVFIRKVLSAAAARAGRLLYRLSFVTRQRVVPPVCRGRALPAGEYAGAQSCGAAVMASERARRCRQAAVMSGAPKMAETTAAPATPVPASCIRLSGPT